MSFALELVGDEGVGDCEEAVEGRADVRRNARVTFARDRRRNHEETAVEELIFECLEFKADSPQHPDMGSRGGPQAARSRGHPGRPGRQEGLSLPCNEQSSRTFEKALRNAQTCRAGSGKQASAFDDGES